jgi:hypothetical protein
VNHECDHPTKIELVIRAYEELNALKQAQERSG